MQKYKLKTEHRNKDQVAEQIKKGLRKFNAGVSKIADSETLVVSVRDESDNLTGGAIGWLWGACMELEFLWLDGAVKSQGVGTALLNDLEKQAQSKGCKRIVTCTFSFQALGFYQKQSYEITHTDVGFPENGKLYHLQKILSN